MCPATGVEPHSRADRRFVENCCLCIASAVVVSQVFGGRPEVAVWSARCNQEKLCAEGESRDVEFAGSRTCLSNSDLQSNFLLWPTLTWNHMGRGFWKM